MSLSCALWATSLHQWARRYLRQSQPSRCNAEKRARMRAFFAEGVDNMHIPWAVEGLPTLLHLSLFLFFGGLAIFLFDVDREVFGYVVWWIGLFCLVYGVITVLPLIRQDSPYNSPLSTPAWFLRAAMSYVTVKMLTFVIYTFGVCFYICLRFCYSSRFDDPITFIMNRILDSVIHLGKYYRRRILGGVEMAIEEAVSKRLSKIDVRILEWTITTLGDDDSLKNFFEAIPGFFNSKLVQHLEGRFPEELRSKYSDALKGFLDRTWTSNSINNSEKTRRVVISMKAMNWIHDSYVSSILRDVSIQYWDEFPHTLEMGQSLARWCTSHTSNNASHAKTIIARILASVQKRDDRWIALAARAFGVTEQDHRESVALGDDSILLDIFIHVTRHSLLNNYSYQEVSEAIPKFDILNTLPRLQHDFCTLWNEIVQEAGKGGRYSTPVKILRDIRHHYIALHQGTDAAPTAFSASTYKYYGIVYKPSSYPLCNLASHRLDSIAQIPVPNLSQVSLTTQPVSRIDGGNAAVTEPLLSSKSTTAQRGATSHGPDVTSPTNPVHSSSRTTGTLPTAVVSPAPQDITSTDTQSHYPEGSEQQDSDIVIPSTEPGTGQILSAISIPAPAPRLAPIPKSLPNTPSKSYVAGVTSVSNSSHLSPPSISYSIPASGSMGSATVPRLRARGLVNTRNMCFANAVLQLLVNLPPSGNLFTELCDLKGRHGAAVFESGDGATPLVDATARFLKEFMVEESPSTEQRSQLATGRISRAGGEKEDGDVVDSFEPTYIYDVMKEKGQLKYLIVRFRANIATSRY